MEDFLYALRNFDGIGYYLTAILCVVLIMAILGFLMERAQLREEKLILAKTDENSKKQKNTSSPLLNSNMQSDDSSVLNNSMTPVNGVIDFTIPSNTSMTNTNSSTSASSVSTETSVENVASNGVTSNSSVNNVTEEVLNSEVPPVLELNSSELENNVLTNSDIK